MFFQSKSCLGRLWAPALRAMLGCLFVCLHLQAHAEAGSQALPGHVPAILSSLVPNGPLDPTRQLHLAITLPLRNQDALHRLLRELYDPASPNYRHFLKPSEFTAAFGPTVQDYQAVQAYARAHHLRITGVYANRALIDVDGAVPDVESAFHVTLQEYSHPTEKRTFYAPDREPSVDLATPILHVSGLDNLGTCKPLSVSAPIGSTKPAGGSGPGGNYIGADFRNAYAPGVTLTGTGQSIALLEFDSYSASDIQTYESQASIPSVTCTNVIVDSYNGQGHSSSGQFEVTLDIETAIAMAPGVSNIIVYEAPPNDWIDILTRIADDDLANQVSCSWYESGAGENSSADDIFNRMAMQGQTFYAASGDTDAYTGLISFPEDDPYITLVGGTQLSTSGGSWSSETVWNSGGGVGSGGGISTQYGIPSWQQAASMLSNAGSTSMRNVPDVALTGISVYVYQGGGYSAHGTSCAAPLWAGFTALINQQAAANGYSKVGFINTALYTLASSSAYSAAFHDISTGNNTSSSSPNQFYATTNYDLCTGLGTPAGQPLINDLSAAPDSLNVSFGSVLASGKAGGPFTPANTNFTLKNQSSSPISWTASATQSWLTLSATSGSIPANSSTNFTASINANANTLASGTYSDTISITDSATGFVQYRPVVLAVIPPPVITSPLTATATTSANFTYQITATNGPTSYNATNLPSGVTVNTSTGVISGRPSTSSTGTYNVPLSATNVGGAGTATLVLTVVPPPPVITSPTTAKTVLGTAFSYTIAASNKPASFNATPLPSGLVVSTTSGIISGTTTATGATSVTISASNAGGTGSATLLVTVQPPAPVITSATSATAVKASAFTYQITASNSPTTFAATSLPSGLSVSTSTGLISGTPTATGTTNSTISAANVTGTGTAILAITVLPPPPVITSATSATPIQGSPFTYQITASNSPSSFSTTTLPAGLTLNNSTGLISGTATATGASSATISATNLGGTGSATLFFNVLPPPPVITSSTNVTATQGAAFSYQITATNNPASFAASNLPSGLTVNTSNGLVSGTPATIGTSNATISAINLGGTGSAILYFNIVPPPPVITSSTNVTATQGTAFTYQITATNNPASFAASNLPSGLTVNASNGLVSGTPTTIGTSNATVSAVNLGGTGSAIVYFNVLPPPPPVITSSTTAVATVGTAFSYQITATNQPIGYSVDGLPAGLGVDASSGLISGTLASSGTIAVTVDAANGSGTGSALVTILAQTPYQAWQSSVFNPAQLADPTISGDMAAPAGDGIPNLLKYALGLNPFITGNASLPTGSVVTTGSGNYLSLTFPEVLSATDITYSVQVSTDTQTWNSGPGFTNPPAPVGSSNGIIQLYNVQAAQSTDSQPVQFIRLQVTGP